MRTLPPAPAEKHFKYSQLSKGREFKVFIEGEAERLQPQIVDVRARLLPQGLGYGECHAQHYLYKGQNKPPMMIMKERVEKKHIYEQWEAETAKELAVMEAERAAKQAAEQAAS